MLGSCRGWGSPFFRPVSSFAFQVSVHCYQRSSGQGFLHLAQEGCRKAQAQKKYRNGSVLSRGDHSPVKMPSPWGCSRELPPMCRRVSWQAAAEMSEAFPACAANAGARHQAASHREEAFCQLRHLG